MRTVRMLTVLVLAAGALTAGTLAAIAQGADVQVADNRFEPATIEVEVGTTVTWTHSGSNPHTVTAADGSWDSNPDCNGFADAGAGHCMTNGQTFQHTFSEPGTYTYYCKLHGTADGQGMAGTIVVRAAGTTGGQTSQPAAQEPEVEASITASDQSGDGTSVRVDSVTITGAPGFVVIHADGGGAPGPVIGHAPIPEGTSTGVVVPLDQPLTASATVWPMVHVDAGTRGTYEFPGPDVPAQTAGGDIAVVSLAYTLTLPRTGAAPAGLLILAGLLVAAGGVLLRWRPARR